MEVPIADQRRILTDKNISRLPLATEEQYKARANELHGLFVLFGKLRYRDAHMKRKGRNPGTIESYRDHMERLFEGWLDKASCSAEPATDTARGAA